MKWLVVALAKLYLKINFRGYGFLNYQVFSRITNRNITVNVHGYSKFNISLTDPYWNFLLIQDYRHEPEIGFFLDKTLMPGTTFIDGGANYGYWTLKALELLTENCVIAIEAASETYELLEANLKLNRKSSILYNCAISQKSGQTVDFETVGKYHAGASVTGKKDRSNISRNLETVSTISLDDITEGILSKRFVVKLDIEGSEIDGFRGAEKLLKKDTAIIFEEISQKGEVCKYVLSQRGLKLAKINTNGTITLVEEFAEAREIIINSKHGANFVCIVSDSSFKSLII
tara:strand:+ start:1135 stop:1998 length:864 start_codon:yes stop_codon:yes gene_type:complete